MGRGARRPPGTTRVRPGPAEGELGGGRGAARPPSPGEWGGVRLGGRAGPALGVLWDPDPATTRRPRSLAQPWGPRGVCSASQSSLWDEKRGGGFPGDPHPRRSSPLGSDFGRFLTGVPRCECTARLGGSIPGEPRGLIGGCWGLPSACSSFDSNQPYFGSISVN